MVEMLFIVEIGSVLEMVDMVDKMVDSDVEKDREDCVIVLWSTWCAAGHGEMVDKRRRWWTWRRRW